MASEFIRKPIFWFAAGILLIALAVFSVVPKGGPVAKISPTAKPTQIAIAPTVTATKTQTATKTSTATRTATTTRVPTETRLPTETRAPTVTATALPLTATRVNTVAPTAQVVITRIVVVIQTATPQPSVVTAKVVFPTAQPSVFVATATKIPTVEKVVAEPTKPLPALIAYGGAVNSTAISWESYPKVKEFPWGLVSDKNCKNGPGLVDGYFRSGTISGCVQVMFMDVGGKLSVIPNAVTSSDWDYGLAGTGVRKTVGNFEIAEVKPMRKSTELSAVSYWLVVEDYFGEAEAFLEYLKTIQ